MITGTLLLVIAFLVFRQSPPPVSVRRLPGSGDRLYDQLASLLNTDLQTNDYNLVVPDDYIFDSGLDFSKSPAHFRSQEILRWSSEFGSDPRFWQLCWLMRSHGSAEQYSLPERYVSLEFMDAWQRGIRDEASCYLLLLQSEPAMREKIIDAGLAGWPDNSFWHYQAAELALGQADWSQFLVHMETGNAAGRNELPRAWPISLIGSAGWLPDDADSEAVQGVIAQLARSQREAAMKTPADPLAVQESTKLSAGFIQSFVEMQVRLASMQGNGLEQLWRPAKALVSLLGSQGLGESWSSTDQARLARQLAWAQELAGLNKPALFGAAFDMEEGLPGDSRISLDSGEFPQARQFVERDQASWINTLHSYELDLQRARELSASFAELQAGSTVPLRINR